MLENNIVMDKYDDFPDDREECINEQIDLAYEQHIDRLIFAETR